MRIVLVLTSCVLVLSAGIAPAQTPVNQQAIQQVQSGQCKEARASWWGFDRQEATSALQAAINSGVPKVIVDKMDSPWIVDKLDLAANQELFFESGTVVQAKKGAFHGKQDSLFSAWGKSNIKLIGPGATLRMHRDDYASPDYTKAEWRHVLNFHGCSNVTIIGLTLSESGGDGIYLGAGRDGATNKNFVIRDVTCDRNYRQGISVITAENLLIENCVLKDTAGTAPAAGIDFEPNHPRERLVNCVMRNCVMENNRGYGLHIYARPLDGTTVPMSLRIENCVTRGTNARSVSVVTSCGPKGPVQGLVEVLGCRFEDVGKAGVNIGSKPPAGAKVRFVDCVLADPADEPAMPPIVFSTRAGDLDNVGGVEFVNLVLKEKVDRPLMRFHDAIGAQLLDIRGNLVIERNGQRTAHTIDQALINQWIPFDPVAGIAKQPLDLAKLQAPAAAPSAKTLKIPPHRLRDESLYLVAAQQGQSVALRLKSQAVGRREVKAVSVQVRDPSGKPSAKFTLEGGSEGDFSFRASQTGVYSVLCQPQKHTVRMVSCSHPVSIGGIGGRIHFLSTTGEFVFRVPAGTPQFGVRIMGEGEGECVKATLFDPSGRQVWQQDKISSTQSYRSPEGQPALAGVWKLRLDRPGSGAMEDHYVELRGVAPVLGFHAETLPETAP